MRLLSILWSLLFFISSAWSMTQKILSEYSVKNSQDRLTLGEETLEKKVKRKSFSLQYQAEELLKYGVVSTTFRREHPDYSATVLRDKFGREYLLDPNGEMGEEDFFRISLGMKTNQFSTNVAMEKNLSPTPYSQRGISVGFSYYLFQQRELLSSTISVQEQGRPQSYYVTSDFKEGQRPTLVRNEKWQVSWEHILSERLKGQVFFHTGIKREERPRNYGGGLKMAFGPSDRLYIKAGLWHMRENDKRILQNEVGYLKFNQFQGEVVFEPTYDFLVGLSYYLTMETERDPRTKRQVRYASDEYALGMTNKWGLGSMSTSLKVSHLRTNQSFQAWNVTGNIEWTL